MSDFIKGKFDNICLFVIIIVLVFVMKWADNHSSDNFLAWLEQTTTVVLGAYIGLTQAARTPWTKQQGGNNGNDTKKVNGGGVGSGAAS
jgi:hypothetical protein